jgi:hypothetical protein
LARGSDLPQRVDGALTALAALANAAESLPPPAEPAVPGLIVRRFRANPVAGVLLAFLGALAVLAVGGLLMLALFLGAMSLR